jgi:hypothetical protein
MVRKVLNRKELRQENDEAERQGVVEKKKRAKKAVKKTTKRRSSAKSAKEVRLKAYWGVFNQSLRRVALFEYSERKKAEKKAQELSESNKSPHFVRLAKQVIEE